MKLKINTAEYEVKEVLSSDTVLSMPNYKGLCDKDNKKIYISSDLPNKRETLIHEITHAMIYEYLGYEKGIEWDEEKVCQFVERYIDKILGLLEKVLFKIEI